jgi:hypothetical protein
MTINNLMQEYSSKVKEYAIRAKDLTLEYIEELEPHRVKSAVKTYWTGLQSHKVKTVDDFVNVALENHATKVKVYFTTNAALQTYGMKVFAYCPEYIPIEIVEKKGKSYNSRNLADSIEIVNNIRKKLSNSVVDYTMYTNGKETQLEHIVYSKKMRLDKLMLKLGYKIKNSQPNDVYLDRLKAAVQDEYIALVTEKGIPIEKRYKEFSMMKMEELLASVKSITTVEAPIEKIVESTTTDKINKTSKSIIDGMMDKI